MGTEQKDQLDIRPEDLEILVSGGFILRGKLGDLIRLRQALRGDSRFKLIYVCNSTVPLYVVDGNEFALVQKLKESSEGM